MVSRLARCLGAFALVGLLVEGVAASPAPKAVIELFTSQGCSSCPPADAYLAELARRPEVVALSLPVDYWDYLGWKDTLASPAFTARQRAYAGSRGDRQVYTPQAIVNGSVPCIGSDRRKVESVIAAAAAGATPALPVSVRVRESGSVVKIEIGRATGEAGSAQVWLLPVVKAREVAIGRGENGGRSITYVNVVRGIMRVGDWTGEPARFEVPVSIARPDDAEAYVVLLQAADAAKLGAILGAARSPGL